MDDEKRAQRLADWLEATPGTEPPEDLDPEVLGAVYALAPHRAPPPRVGIEDILAGVTTGPLAAPTMDNVVEFPRRAAAAAPAPAGGEAVRLRPLPSADETLAPGQATHAPSAEAQVGRRAPAPRKPSRWWMGPAFGVGLAAAAAAAIVLPIAGNLASRQISGSEEARLEGAPMTASPAAAPPPQGAKPQREAAGQPADAPAEFAAAERDGNGDSVGRAAAGGGGVGASDAPKSAGPMAGAPSTSAPLAGAPGPAPASVADVAPPPPPAAPATESQGIAELAEESNELAGDWLERKDDSAVMGKKKAEVATAQEAPAPAEPAAGAAASTGAVTAARADKPSGTRASSGGARAKAPSTPAAAPAAVTADEAAPQEDSARRYIPEASRDAEERAEAEDDAAPVKSSTAKSSSNVVTSARSAATPLDYNPSWYSGDPSIAASFDALRAQESAGQWEAAAAGWKALTGHTRADVAQDAALRAGKALRTLGRTTDALAVVDTGLRRSAANTPFRAALLALRGELLLALGRAADAERAFEEAAGLNKRR